MRSRTTLLSGGAAFATAVLGLALVAPAQADLAPAGNDVVGVGSDTVQNIANFLADGDAFLNSSGVNASGGANRLVSFDATPDANARAGYLNGSTPTLQKPLNPTIVLRAGTQPVQRPNGSSAGITALNNDANRLIDYARSSRLPTSAEQNTAITRFGGGGLHVVKIAIDELRAAVANTTNAPVSLTIAQMVGIYQCTITNWSAIGGASGTIIPLLPQTGSGTRSTFLADLQAANGGTAITTGPCVEIVEENDPASITGSASPANTVAPFSQGRIDLYNSGYFKNPNVAFPNAATITSAGVKTIVGTGSYNNNRGLYIVYRDADQNSTKRFQPGGAQNFAQALFAPLSGNPYVAGTDGQAAIAAGGGSPVYKDCGAGTGITVANC